MIVNFEINGRIIKLNLNEYVIKKKLNLLTPRKLKLKYLDALNLFIYIKDKKKYLCMVNGVDFKEKNRIYRKITVIKKEKGKYKYIGYHLPQTELVMFLPRLLFKDHRKFYNINIEG